MTHIRTLTLRLSIVLLLVCSLSFAQTSANPSGLTTLSTPAQIGAQLAASMQATVVTMNNSAVAMYNQAVAVYTAQYGAQPNASAPAPPIPPMLTLVDSAAVIADEVQFGTYLQAGNLAAAEAINWSAVYSQVQYVPVGPPPPPPAPVSVVIGAVYPYAPNFFYAASGDSPSVPAGTVITQNGHQFKKFFVGFGTAVWQQIN